MHSRQVGVTTTSTTIVVDIVSSQFSKVDLAAPGPTPIHRVFRHHPNGWPKPIASWHFGNDFHFAISDCLLPASVQSSGTHGRNDRSICPVRAYRALFVCRPRAASVSASLCQVQSVSVVDLISSDGSSIGREGRNNVKPVLVYKTILFVGGGPVKASVSETVDLDLMVPNVGIESFKLLVEN